MGPRGASKPDLSHMSESGHLNLKSGILQSSLADSASEPSADGSCAALTLRYRLSGGYT